MQVQKKKDPQLRRSLFSSTSEPMWAIHSSWYI